MSGTVIRINPKTATIQASDGLQWRVSLQLLSVSQTSTPTLAIAAQPTVAPPVARVTAAAHRHAWVVISETETGRSANGRAVYSVRDQRCRTCGEHQPAAKWSKTLAR